MRGGSGIQRMQRCLWLLLLVPPIGSSLAYWLGTTKNQRGTAILVAPTATRKSRLFAPFEKYGYQRTTPTLCSSSRASSAGSSSSSSSISSSSTSCTSSSCFDFETALAVVPPDEAWDRLQRARHVANDVSYSQWPPAIRLFHPFEPSFRLHETALRIADIIEAYDVAPFEVTLSEWSIVPHSEAMEAYLQQLAGSRHDETSNAEHDERCSPQEKRVRALIANEEKVGREKLKVRQARQKRKKEIQAQQQEEQQARGNGPQQPAEPVEPTPLPVTTRAAKRKDNKEASSTTSRDSLQQQKEMYEVFNGPCVICLEPDQESKERLQAVRYLLKHELEGSAMDYADLYSPSSSVSRSTSTAAAATSASASPPLRSRKSNLQKSRKHSDDVPESFRPVVPIAAFKTVTAAIEVARKLRKLWDPLTFNVTDLHLLSCRESNEMTTDSSGSASDGALKEPDGLLKEYYSRSANNNKASSDTVATEEERHFSMDNQGNQFCCDALVSFMGCEMEMDQDLNEEMAKMLFEQGEMGGYELQKDDNAAAADDPNTNDNEEPGLSAELERWLVEEDDEYDEGTVVVIGRTQFFTGETRQYVGMPASSTLDSRGRIPSDHFVSGAARRRGSVSRSGALYDDGDWGQKPIDYDAFGKGEKGRKKNNDDSKGLL